MLRDGIAMKRRLVLYSNKCFLLAGLAAPSDRSSRVSLYLKKISSENHAIKIVQCCDSQAKNGLKRLKMAKKHLRYPQIIAIRAKQTPQGANLPFGLHPASFYSTPGAKINAEIVARYEIICNSKFLLEIFINVDFDLWINLQLLSKSWSRLVRLAL